MKVVLYRNKKNMDFSRIEILSDFQIKYLERKTDLLDNFNKNSDIEYATIIDIDNEEFPKDALKFILMSFNNKARIELVDIYEKLKQLEDNIYSLSTEIANVREDIEDVM